MTAELILIVEDDEPIAAFVQTVLDREGYATDVVYNGSQVMERISIKHPDLVLLDWKLPGKDGLQLCQAIRQLPAYIPIIMLTAKDDDTDKIIGLEIGADDYITKPFKSRELVARVHAILRLAQQSVEKQNNQLTFGSLEIDLSGRSVKCAGQLTDLTPKEFDLLAILAANPGRVFSREILLQRVWGYEYLGESRTVDVHIQRLRQKIECDPGQPRFLITVRNYGYKFVK